MIKLTQHEPNEREMCIRIDGRLDAEALGELQGLVGASKHGVTLDLSGLTSLDSAGRALLVELHRGGCVIRGESLYVRSLLEEA